MPELAEGAEPPRVAPPVRIDGARVLLAARGGDELHALERGDQGGLAAYPPVAKPELEAVVEAWLGLALGLGLG